MGHPHNRASHRSGTLWNGLGICACRQSTQGPDNGLCQGKCSSVPLLRRCFWQVPNPLLYHFVVAAVVLRR